MRVAVAAQAKSDWSVKRIRSSRAYSWQRVHGWRGLRKPYLIGLHKGARSCKGFPVKVTLLADPARSGIHIFFCHELCATFNSKLRNTFSHASCTIAESTEARSVVCNVLKLEPVVLLGVEDVVHSGSLELP